MEEMEVNPQGGTAHKIPYDPTELPANALIGISRLMAKNRAIHGEKGNWKKLTVEEHLKHSMAHYLEFQVRAESHHHDKDKMEAELVRYATRAILAYSVFLENVKCENCGETQDI